MIHFLIKIYIKRLQFKTCILKYLNTNIFFFWEGNIIKKNNNLLNVFETLEMYWWLYFPIPSSVFDRDEIKENIKLAYKTKNINFVKNPLLVLGHLSMQINLYPSVDHSPSMYNMLISNRWFGNDTMLPVSKKEIAYIKVFQRPDLKKKIAFVY